MLNPEQYLVDRNTDLTNTVHIWTSQYSKYLNDLKHYSGLLTQDESLRAQRYHKQQDQYNAILGFAWRRIILGYYLKQEPQSLQFDYHKDGKPSLPDIHFNITHSGDFWALSMSHSLVGIDIEIPKSNIEILSIAKRFYTAQEAQRIIDSANPRQLFYQIWVAKEALLKACGKGILSGLNQVEIPAYNLKPVSINLDNTTWFLREIELWKMSHSALVTQHELQNINIIHF